MFKDLVSIALCTFNGEKYLHEQLDSILLQTYDNIEIVIVDDCSTDNTFLILKEYAFENENVRIFQNEKNLGFVKNFERALKKCKGKYIVFSDQDDIWQSNKIERQVSEFKNCSLIYHNSSLMQHDGIDIEMTIKDIINMYDGNNPNVFLLQNCISGHSIMIESQLVSEILPFPDGFYHDWWTAFVAANLGGVKYIDECLVKYRQHLQSQTNIMGVKNKERWTKKDAISYTQWHQKVQGYLVLLDRFDKKRYPDFFSKFKRAWSKHALDYFSFRLFIIMLLNCKTLQFCRKKTFLSKMNYSIKFLWGIPLKKLWYTYIVSKPEVIAD